MFSKLSEPKVYKKSTDKSTRKDGFPQRHNFFNEPGFLNYPGYFLEMSGKKGPESGKNKHYKEMRAKNKGKTQ